MLYRIVNTSQTKSHGGMFLDMGPDYKNFMIATGKYWQGELPSIPQFILEWQEQGLCRILNATTGADIAPVSAQFTPGQLSPLREMRGIDPKGSDPFDDEEPDLALAVDATLPPLPSIPGAALGTAAHGRPPGPGEVEGAHMPERPGQPARPSIAP